MMIGHLKRLPIIKKVLLFSFCITFIVVISIASISFFLQTKQMEAQIEDRIVGLATLWSSTIRTNDVINVIENRTEHSDAHKRLERFVSLIKEKHSVHLDSGIVLPEIQKNEGIYILVGSHGYGELGLYSFSNYQAEKEYITAFKEAVKTKTVTFSGLYRDQYGLWVTAFSPIMDDEGKVVALLAIDANATLIDSFQKELATYLFLIFVIISIIVFYILKRGLYKVLEPMNEIIKGINEVSKGNFDVKLHVDEETDLSLLFDRFNFMTDQLSTLFEQLSITSKQLGAEIQQHEQIGQFELAFGEMENIIQKSKLQRELQRAEKMNAIGQLAASVAHEIRNPMTVVKGFLQIFLSKDELSKEEHMYVKLMIEEMNRAENIINDYLSLAKPDLEQTEKVDAGLLVNKVTDLMNSYAMMSKSIELKTDISEEVFIKGNLGELKQVLINILKNGIEAIKEKGTLSIRVYKENGFGVLQIEDTGVGMTQEELERLGTAFYSLKEKGTGIGLMVCYQIIERMKGNISVTSEKGKGTEFTIKIPLYINNG
ncbi:ATP-binding protein [Bacillus sp. 31A1R]|uniref:histidine kinase n=1 Tax=Robertmurraya mangrovi TaxID=3098077 RepID=A0ABU5J140_9BACI|nr:ATP-binding protein [Bacillus sp. 31A1R]MDZ5473123.1 ATP-binding protein [Bacillus sp. 31A1R]